MRVIRHADAGTKCVARREVFMPVAVFGGEDKVRTMASVCQPMDPGEAVGDRRAARSGNAEGQRPGAVSVHRRLCLSGYQFQRFVPGNALPSAIGLPFRAGAPQGVEETVRPVNGFRGCLGLHAQRLASRMRGITIYLCKDAISHRA